MQLKAFADTQQWLGHFLPDNVTEPGEGDRRVFIDI